LRAIQRNPLKEKETLVHKGNLYCSWCFAGKWTFSHKRNCNCTACLRSPARVAESMLFFLQQEFWLQNSSLSHLSFYWIKGSVTRNRKNTDVRFSAIGVSHLNPGQTHAFVGSAA